MKERWSTSEHEKHSEVWKTRPLVSIGHMRSQSLNEMSVEADNSTIHTCSDFHEMETFEYSVHSLRDDGSEKFRLCRARAWSIQEETASG